MERKQIGKSGLFVSELCLGCMTFGEPKRGNHLWTLPEEQSKPLIRQALDAGIDFFDTANVYSDGSSEEILGRVLWKWANRDEIVLATKVFGDKDPNWRGLSRRIIMRQIDDSLKRLQTDYVDLYQIHRWDPVTPIEETMEALNDVVRAGKARYIGASSMYAWQLAKAQQVAKENGWTRFTSMQNQINLIYREEEREMIPLCLDQGIGLIPWSPIARGKLARPVGISTARAETDDVLEKMYSKTIDADNAVISNVEAIAKEIGCPMVQVALAWIRQKEGVAAPIIGYTRSDQLEQMLGGLDLVLDQGMLDRLETPYIPHVPVGF
jgi:aryl-alcohol dehydrogenase-like predicted oxidoreductase